MNLIFNSLLTLLLTYGYPIIVLSMILAYLGIPMPITGMVIASGAFTADGTFNLMSLLSVVFITTMAGDIFGYVIGVRFGKAVLALPFLKKTIGLSKFSATKRYLDRWGAGFIFITRWLITPLGIPVNIIAGIHHYPIKSFLFWSVIGECMWTGIYVYIGWTFGTNWITISQYTTDIPLILTGLTVGIFSVSLGLRLHHQHKRRLIR